MFSGNWRWSLHWLHNASLSVSLHHGNFSLKSKRRIHVQPSRGQVGALGARAHAAPVWVHWVPWYPWSFLGFLPYWRYGWMYPALTFSINSSLGCVGVQWCINPLDYTAPPILTLLGGLVRLPFCSAPTGDLNPGPMAQNAKVLPTTPCGTPFSTFAGQLVLSLVKCLRPGIRVGLRMWFARGTLE